MFLDPTGTISVSLPPGWAFDPISSSLVDLVFMDWTGPNNRQFFVRIRPSHTDSGQTNDEWEAAVRSWLPAEATRVERRKGPAMLVERPGREGRPAQRWAIVRGPRLDVLIEQVGVPLGSALMTPEIAESLRTLNVPANHHMIAPRPESEFNATMKAAHEAFSGGDGKQAALLLAQARSIAKETWLHSLVGQPIPEVPAAIAEAQAALALAEVTGSALFLQQATITLYRCRAELLQSDAPSVPAHVTNVDTLLNNALKLHGKALGEPPPQNPFSACLMRSRLLLKELEDILKSDQPKIGGPWATLAVEDAMTAVAYAGRGLVRTLTSDWAAELAQKGITNEAEQLQVANRIFLVTSLDHLVVAGTLLHAARAQAALDPERATSANCLIAARRLAGLSPSPERDRALVLALSVHAGAFISLGDEPSLKDAAQLLDEAQTLLDRLGDEGELRAQICLNEGWLRHMRKQLDGSLLGVERAIAAAKASGSERLERAARSLRSQFLGIAGRHDEAITEARKALDATHDDAASTHQLNLAVVLHQAGNTKAALDALRAGLAAAAADEPVGPDVLRLLFVAAALLDPIDVARSLATTEAAEAVLDVLRIRLGNTMDRVGFDDADRHREVAATLVQRRLAVGDILGALATADRHRARSLAETRGTGTKPDKRNAGIQPSLPATDAPLDEQVAFVAACARTALVQEGFPPPLDGRALADVVANAGCTAILFHPSADDLLIFVVRPGHDVTIATATATKSVKDILQITDALRSQLGIIVAARSARGDAPVQSIEDLTKSLADDDIDAADTALDELRSSLHDALFSKVLPLLNEGEPIIVVPYRELAVIPLSVLIDADGRSLAEKHSVSVLPSLASLGALTHPAGSVAQAVVVGDPAVSPELTLGPLPGAATEAQSVANALQQAGIATTLLLHEKATEAAFREHSRDAQVVHLACHATVRQKSSASSLFLAPEFPEDGVLLPDEIADLRLDGALVVLAACQSGLGRTTADGVLGLGRAFLQAGACVVVLSLWRVSDAATSYLMQAFYSALLGQALGVDGRLDVATAMRYAQDKTRDAISADPSLWGPWLVVGDGGWRIV